MPFGHIWSLSVEEHSYIVLSLMAFLARRKIAEAPPLIGATLLAMIACSIYYSMTLTGIERSDASLRTEVAAFGIFASGALLLFFHKRALPRLSVITYAVILLGAILLSWWRVPMLLRDVAGMGALANSVNLLPAAPPLVRQALATGWLRQIGLCSF